LVEADWKQLEVRVVTEHSQDQELLRQFREGEDIYVAAARHVYGKSEITDPERALAKAAVLARNYGAGAQKIYDSQKPKFPKLTLGAVKDMMAAISAAHPELEEHRAWLWAQAQQNDYVEDPIGGRREYFWGAPELSKTLNFPQQAGGAALVTMVALKIRDELNWRDEGILLQYHDALILDGPDPVRLYQILRKHMRFERRGVLYDIDVKVGRNWRDMTKVTCEADIIALINK
jgi:DNA polymerase-1